MELHEELRYRADEIARHRENSARLAQVNAKYTTSGQGSIEFPDRVEFGLTYIEEPWMNYGCRVDLDAWADLLGLDAGAEVTPPLPLCTGFVTDWDRDDRDFYIGAWVAVRVYYPPLVAQVEGSTEAALTVEVPVDVNVDLTHYFTFAGVAMKDVPLEGATD